MLSREQIEAYRRMSVEERWKIVEEPSSSAWEALMELPHAERERRLALARVRAAAPTPRSNPTQVFR